MWQTKHFKSFKQQEEWIEANKNRYQISRIFVNNGYAVEYKPLTTINFQIGLKLLTLQINN